MAEPAKHRREMPAERTRKPIGGRRAARVDRGSTTSDKRAPAENRVSTERRPPADRHAPGDKRSPTRGDWRSSAGDRTIRAYGWPPQSVIEHTPRGGEPTGTGREHTPSGSHRRALSGEPSPAGSRRTIRQVPVEVPRVEPDLLPPAAFRSMSTSMPSVRETQVQAREARQTRETPTPETRTSETPIRGTQSRVTSSRAAARVGSAVPAAPTGQRKKPGGHRRAATKTKSRSFPAVPAVAGVAAILAAATGAVTLHSTGNNPALASGSEQGQASMALSVAQLRDARAAAASRADRGSRSVEADDKRVARAKALEEAKDRAAWEKEHTQELARIEQQAEGGSDLRVLERTIRWYLPLRSFRMSAGFGESSSLWSSTHTGQDFSAPNGTPIRAVGDGEIIEAGWDGPYGNKIVMRHLDGTETWYCHQSGFAVTGGFVRAGEIIGYVGSTGNSTGAHLHFEVRPGGGDPIDPIPWLRSQGLDI